MKLDLHYYGDPVLREKTAPVADVTDDVRRFAQDLIETMRAEQGVGLAAPQVGRSIAVCVVEIPAEYDMDEDGRREHPDVTMPLILINPEVVEPSRKIDYHEEGCLSFPGIRASIPRALEITVRFLDPEGRKRELRLKNFLARVVQHEVDHLMGVLFIDRMSAPKRFALTKRLKKMRRETEEALGLV